MYYRLKQTYVLRGWKKIAWALVKRPENIVEPIKQEEFQALLLCDGETDMEAEYVSDEMRAILRKYEEEDIIELCQDRCPLDEDQFYQYYDNRYVRSVFWSVTGRCNFRCRHCYMDAPEGMLGELSREEAFDLIDQMAECGVLCVDITGGEPFVRKDFFELVDRIQSYKMTVGQIYTNGWLLTDAVLEEFEKRGLKPEFSISFDGIGWHDWMRGIRGAEEAAIRALRLCQAHGFPMNVEMCVHKGNKETIRETVKLLVDADVPLVKISNVSPTVLWERNSEGNALDIRAYTEAMLRYVPQFFEDGMPMNVMLSGVVKLRKDSKEYEILPIRYNGKESCQDCHLCGVTRYTCYITPEGRLLPCMPMTAYGNQDDFPLIKDIGLKKGLSDSFYMDIVDSRVKDLLAVNPKCAACAHKYQCGGGCRATAVEQGGGLMGCDGDQCILWNEGYVERIRKTVEDAIARYCSDR